MSSKPTKEEKSKEVEGAFANNTPLIDVIRKISPYLPRERIAKWRATLAQEDMDYLLDALVVPGDAISLHKFSTRLYGELLRVRKLPIIQMKIMTKTDDDGDAHEITIRKQYEGSYVDIGDRLQNTQRVFVQVNEYGGVQDLSQKIVYLHSDNHWRFYTVSNSDKGHYMLHSNETKDTHFEKLTWSYHHAKKQTHAPIELQIQTWNI